MPRPPRMLALSALLLLPLLVAAGDDGWRDIPGGRFVSALRFDENRADTMMAPYQLMTRPVSNAQFAAFLRGYPQWRRDRVPAVFSAAGYLSHWRGDEAVGDPALENAPVVQVTWYAADAYCRAQQARLPTFLEWEFAAAADQDRADARTDAAFRLATLNDATPRARDGEGAAANVYGVYALHGRQWEWTDDFSSLLATNDRGSDDGDALRFCGATSLAFNDREQYGVAKRFAVLSALKPGDALAHLGFRCARSLP